MDTDNSTEFEFDQSYIEEPYLQLIGENEKEKGASEELDELEGFIDGYDDEGDYYPPGIRLTYNDDTRRSLTPPGDVSTPMKIFKTWADSGLRVESNAVRVISQQLRLNIFTYNSNIIKYKQLGVLLENVFKSIVQHLLQSYNDLSRILAKIVLLRMRNFLSAQYEIILESIRNTFDMYIDKVINRIRAVKVYLALVENTLMIHGWTLVQIVSLLNPNSFDFGPLGEKKRVFKSRQDIQQLIEDGNSRSHETAFIKCIEESQVFIYFKVYKEIRKRFQDITWLHKYLRDNSNFSNFDCFLLEHFDSRVRALQR